jgi:hypothetical protein
MFCLRMVALHKYLLLALCCMASAVKASMVQYRWSCLIDKTAALAVARKRVNNGVVFILNLGNSDLSRGQDDS